MPDIVIDLVDPADTGLLAHLYNQIFRPERSAEVLGQRYRGRNDVVILVARIGNDSVGFYAGFELKPGVHFAWLCGVVPSFRRQGIGTQLMEAAEDWVKTHGYKVIRMECYNNHRHMLQFAIASGYDIVGIRWDADAGQNLIIFEHIFGAI
ncbi:MAG TPA: GNAT family N-acetyltransferase [Phycisphaeraceae bacterium]|nr:GNAT family N-acetyltransferase [Phycisphaeraceae bacterium]